MRKRGRTTLSAADLGGGMGRIDWLFFLLVAAIAGTVGFTAGVSSALSSTDRVMQDLQAHCGE